MTSQEYYEKMDALRQRLHDNKCAKCEELDQLAGDHKRKMREEMDFYEKEVRKVKMRYSEMQNDIEHAMNALKKQWHIEHPMQEVKVVE